MKTKIEQYRFTCDRMPDNTVDHRACKNTGLYDTEMAAVIEGWDMWERNNSDELWLCPEHAPEVRAMFRNRA